MKPEGGARIAVMVRGHAASVKLTDLASSLAASHAYDVYIATDDTRGPVAVGPFPRASYTTADIRDLGFDLDDQRFLVDCADVLFAHIQRKAPGYDYYALIEYDVGISAPPASLFEEILRRINTEKGPPFDAILTHSMPAGPLWAHHGRAAEVFAEVWSSLFPFVVVSSRAASYLLDRRLKEGPLDLPTQARVFCEAFLPSALVEAGFRIVDLNQILPGTYGDGFYWGPPMLLGSEAARDERWRMFHPVYAAREFLDRHLADAAHTGTLRHFSAALQDQDLPVEDRLRRHYTERALSAAPQALARPTGPGSGPPDLAADLPVVILPRNEARPRGAGDPTWMSSLGDRPVAAHAMEHLAANGVTEFVLPGGRDDDGARSYFIAQSQYGRNTTLDLNSGAVTQHPSAEAAPASGRSPRQLHLLAHLENASNGARLAEAFRFLGERRIMVAYGDCLTDLDLAALLAFHLESGKAATVTAVRPSPMVLALTGRIVQARYEAPQLGEGRLNGGFMVLEPEVFQGMGDEPLEHGVLARMTREDRLGVYLHDGFWQDAATACGLNVLRQIWAAGDAPWRSD